MKPSDGLLNYLMHTIGTKLSLKQLIQLNTLMTIEGRIKYLQTFIGFKDKNISIARLVQVDKDMPQAKVYIVKGEMITWWDNQQRKRYNNTTDKIPDTSKGWYGVEIECFLPTSNFPGHEERDCDGACRDNCNCYTCDSCGHTDDNRDCSCECDCNEGNPSSLDAVREELRRIRIKDIQVVEDGSLQAPDDHFSLEIKVLFKLSNTTNLEQVCKFLKDSDAVVNTSCGLHVHMDARIEQQNGTHPALVEKFKEAMLVLSHMLPKSRRDNTYCKDGASYTDRYHKVNACSLLKHGTLEIRAHSGTVTINKILNWVRILDAIRQGAALPSFHDHESLVTYFSSIGMASDLRAYIIERITKFSPNSHFLTTKNEIETVESEDSELEEVA